MNTRADKKHIGFVITSLVGGGAEKVVLTLAEEMVKQGHHVDIYVLTKRENYMVAPDVHVHYLSSANKVPSVFSALFYRRLAKKLVRLVGASEQNNGKHDLMLFNLPEDYVLGNLVNFENAYFCLHTSISMSLEDQMHRSKARHDRLQEKYLALNGKNVIAVSQGVADELEGLNWLSVNNVAAIYNPFDVDEITRLAEDKVDGNIDYKYIIHIGRAARLKRHDLLFKALQSVPEEYRLVLLSKDNTKLRKLADKYGVTDRIILPGFQSNPYKWIKHAELLVLCSDYEGLGNVLIESLICGTPVVSTDCPYGPAEIMTEQLSEYLTPVGDSDALAEKIQRALCTKINIDKPDILDKVDIRHVVEKYLALA